MFQSDIAELNKESSSLFCLLIQKVNLLRKERSRTFLLFTFLILFYLSPAMVSQK